MNAAELVDALSYQNRPNVRGGKNPQQISATWLNYTSGSDALSDTSVANGVRKLAHVKDLQASDIVEMLYFPERQEYLIIGRLHRVGERAGLPEIGRPSFVKKTSDESVTSSTVLQDDDELTFPVVSGLTYQLDLNLIYRGASSTTVGSLQWGLTFPGGSGFYGGQVNGAYMPNMSTTTSTIIPYGQNLASASTTINGTGGFNSGTWAGTTEQGLFLTIRGLVVAGGDGSVTLQWAQWGSSATPTTIRAGSWGTLTRLA